MMSSFKTLCAILVLFSSILLTTLAQSVPTTPSSSNDIYYNSGEVVLTAEGPAIFRSDVSIQGPLSVGGAGSITQGLTVDGPATFNDLAISADLTVAAVTRATTFTVAATANLLGDTLAGTEDSSFTLGRPDAALSGRSTTFSSSTSNSNDVDGDLIIKAGSGVQQGSVYIDGSIIFGASSGFINVTGTTAVSGELNISQDATVSQNLNASLISVNQTVSSTSYQTSSLTANNTNVSQYAMVGTLETTNLSTAGNTAVFNLIVNDVHITNELSVTQEATFSDLTVGSNVNFGSQDLAGNFTVAGDAATGGLNVSGNAILSGDNISLGSPNSTFIISRPSAPAGQAGSTTTISGQDATCANGGDLVINAGTNLDSLAGALEINGGAGLTTGDVNLGTENTNTVNIGNSNSQINFFAPVDVSDLLINGSSLNLNSFQDATISAESDLVISTTGDLSLSSDSAVIIGSSAVSISGNTTVNSDLYVQGSTLLSGAAFGQEASVDVNGPVNAQDLSVTGNTILTGNVVAGSNNVDFSLTGDNSISFNGQTSSSGSGGDINFRAGNGVNGGNLNLAGQSISIGTRSGNVVLGSASGLTTVTGGLTINDTAYLSGGLNLGDGVNSFPISRSGVVNGAASNTYITGQNAAPTGTGGNLFLDADNNIDIPTPAIVGSDDGSVSVISRLVISNTTNIGENLVVDGTVSVGGQFVSLGNNESDFNLRRLTNSGRGTDTTISGQSGQNTGGNLNIAAGTGLESGDVNIASGSGAGASSSGDATFSASNGNITFSSNSVSIATRSGNVNFGKTEINGNLAVAQDGTLNDLTVAGDLTIDGDVDAGPVEATQIAVLRSTNVYGNLETPSSTSDFVQNVMISGSYDTQGPTYVNGSADFSGKLDVNGNVVAGSLTVIEEATVSGNFATSSNLEVDSTLIVLGTALLNNVSLDNIVTETAQVSSLNINGNAEFKNTIATNINTSGRISANVAHLETITTNGEAVFEADVVAQGNLSISGNILSGSLDVASQITASSLVTSNARIYGDVQVATDLNTFNLAAGELTVLGDSNLNNIHVSGDSSLSNINVNTSFNFVNSQSDSINSESLSVSGVVLLNDRVSVGGNMDIQGDLTVNSVILSGNAEIASNVYSGSVSVVGDEFISGYLEVEKVISADSLLVSGSSNFNSLFVNQSLASVVVAVENGQMNNVDASSAEFYDISALNVDATNVSFDGKLSVRRNANFSDVTAAGLVGVYEDASIAGSLLLSSNVVFGSDSGSQVSIQHVGNSSANTSIVGSPDSLLSLVGGSGEELGGSVSFFGANISTSATCVSVFGGDGLSDAGSAVIDAVNSVNLGTAASDVTIGRAGQSVVVNGNLSSNVATNIAGKLIAVGDSQSGSLAVSSDLSANDLTVDGLTSFGSLNADTITATSVEIGCSLCAGSSDLGSLTASSGLVDNDAVTGGDIVVSNSSNILGSLVVEGDASVAGTLNVEDETFVGQDLTVSTNSVINNFVSEMVTVASGQQATIDRSTSVYGDSTVGGNLEAESLSSNNLFICGVTSLSGPINVGGDSSIQGDLSVLGSVEFNADVNIRSSLVAGNSLDADNLYVTRNANLQNVNVGDVTSNSLSVSGSTNLQNTLISGSLLSTGNATSGSVYVQSALSSNSTNISGTSTVGSLKVADSAVILGSSTFSSQLVSGEDVVINGSLSSRGNVVVGDDLILTGPLDVSESANINALSVSGNFTTGVLESASAYIQGSVNAASQTVYGNTSTLDAFISGEITASTVETFGSVTVGSGVSVSQSAYIVGSASLADVNVAAAAHFKSGLSADAFSVGNSLSVSAQANLNDASIIGTFDLAQELDVSGSLSTCSLCVAGDVLSSSQITVSSFDSSEVSASNLNADNVNALGSVQASGNAAIGCGGLTTAGELIVGSDIQVSSLLVDGSEYISTDLNVDGSANFVDIVVKEAAEFSDVTTNTLIAHGPTAYVGDIISGQVYAQEVDVINFSAQTLELSGFSTISADLQVQSGILLNGAASVVGGISAGGLLAVGGNLSTLNTDVTGPATISSDATVKGNQYISGNLDVLGRVHLVNIDLQATNSTGNANNTIKITDVNVNVSTLRVDELTVDDLSTNNLVVTEPATLNGPIDILGSLTSGPTSVSGNYQAFSLSVASNITSNSNPNINELSVSQNSFVGEYGISGELSVSSSVSVGQSVNAAGSLSAAYLEVESFISNSLEVQQDTYIRGNLAVNGDATLGCDESTIDGTLIVAGPASVNRSVVVAGNLDVDSSLSATSYLSDTAEFGSLNAESVTVATSALFNTTLVANSASTVIFSSESLTISGSGNVVNLFADNVTTTNVAFSQELNVDSVIVDGSVSVEEESFISGNVTLGGRISTTNIAVVGTIAAADTIIDANEVSVNGASSLGYLSAATIESILASAQNTVLEDLEASGDLTVSRNANLGVTQILGDFASGALNLNGTLQIDNNAAINSLTVPDNANLNDLSVRGESRINDFASSGDLQVSGTAGSTFGADVSVSGTTNVPFLRARSSATSECLSVNENSILNGNLDVASTILVGAYGVTTEGSLSSSSDGQNIIGGQIRVTDEFSVDGFINTPGQISVSNDARFGGSIEITNSLSIAGDNINTGELSAQNIVTGSISGSDLSVSGPTTINGDLDITGTTSLGCGSNTITGPVSISGDGTFTNDISLSQNLFIGGDLTSTGAINVAQDFTAGDSQFTQGTIGSSLSVSGNATLGSVSVVDITSAVSSAQFTGLTYVQNRLDASAATVAQDTQVSGSAVFQAAFIAAGSLSSGPLTVGGDLNTESSVNVQGSINAVGSLNAGSIDLAADLSLSGDLSVETGVSTATANINGQLNVTDFYGVSANFVSLEVENAHARNNLNVNSTLNVRGTASIHDNLDIGASLTVGATTHADDDVYLEANLIHYGSARARDSFTAVGPANVAGDLTSNTLNVQYNAIIGQTVVAESIAANRFEFTELTVAGTTLLGGGFIVNGDLTVNSRITSESLIVEQFLNVTRDTRLQNVLANATAVSQELSLEGNATFSNLTAANLESESALITFATLNELTVSGDASLSGSLSVAGVSSFGSGTVFTAGDLNIAGDFNLGQDLTVQGNALATEVNINSSATLSNLNAANAQLGQTNVGSLTVQGNAVFDESTQSSTISSTQASAGSISADSLLNEADVSVIDLVVGKDAIYGSNLNVAGEINVARGASIGGSVLIDGDLSITRSASVNELFATDITVTNNAIVDGNIFDATEMFMNNAVFINITAAAMQLESLIVNQSASVGGNINVDGNAIFGCQGDVAIAGPLSATEISVEGSATILGDASITGEVSASRSGHFGYVTVSGDSSLSNTEAHDISITGDATLNGLSTIDGELSTLGQVSISGFSESSSLTVSGQVISSGDFDVNNDLVVSGSLFAFGGVSAGENTNVLNMFTVNGFATVNDELSVTGGASLAGSLTVSANSRINGELSSSGFIGAASLIAPGEASVGTLTAADTTVEGYLRVVSDVSINGNLSIYGPTTFRSGVSVSNAAPVIADGPVVVDKALTVGGNTTITQDLIISGPLTAGSSIQAAALILSGNLLALNDTTVSTDVELENGLVVMGSTTLGDTTLNSSSPVMTQFDAVFFGMLSIDQDLNMEGMLEMSIGAATSIQGNISTLGSLLAQSLTVDSPVSIDSQLTVTGSASLGNDLEVADSALLQSTLCVVGDASLDGDVFLVGDLSVSGTLSVVGSATTDSGVSVSQSANFGGDLSLTGDMSVVQALQTSAGFVDRGDAFVGGAINSQALFSALGSVATDSMLVFGESEVETDLFVIGSTTVNNVFVAASASVSGRYIGEGNVAAEIFNIEDYLFVGESMNVGSDPNSGFISTLGTDLFVAGDAALGFDLSIGGDASILNVLSVTGDSTISGALTANGDGFFNGDLFSGHDLSIGTNLEVVQDATIGGDLTVNGNTQSNEFGGEVTVSGSSTFDGSLFINGEATVGMDSSFTDGFFSGDLSVSGDSLFSGSLSVEGPASLGSDLTVVRDTMILGALTVNGIATSESNIIIGGQLSAGQSLVVDGPTSGTNGFFNGDVTVLGTTFAQADLFVSGSVSVLGNVYLLDPTFRGNLNADGFGSFQGNMVVGQDAYLNELTVRGDVIRTMGQTSVSGNLDAVQNLTVAEDLTVQGSITAFGTARFGAVSVDGPLSVAGSVSFDDDVTVDGAINVSLNVEINDDLSVDRDAYLNNVTVDNLNAQFISAGTLEADGESTISGNLITNVLSADTLDAGQASFDTVVISESLVVSGPTLFDSDVLARQDATVAGTLFTGAIVSDNTSFAPGTVFPFNNIFVAGDLTADDIDTQVSNITNFVRTQRFGFPYNGADNTTDSVREPISNITEAFPQYIVSFAPTSDADGKFYALELTGFTLNFLEPGKVAPAVFRFETISFSFSNGNNGNLVGDILYRYEVGDIILVKGPSDLNKLVNLWDFEDVASSVAANTANGNLYLGRTLMTESLNVFSEALNSDEVALFMYSPRPVIGSNAANVNGTNALQDTPVEWVKIL